MSRVKDSFRKRTYDTLIRSRFASLRDKVPPNRPLTSSARRDVLALLSDLENYYLSKLSFMDAEPKRVIQQIKASLQPQPNVDQFRRTPVSPPPPDVDQLKRNLDALEI